MFTTNHPDVHRFSTDTLPLRERTERWREEFGRPVARLDFEAAGDGPYSCEVTLAALPRLGLGSVAASATRVLRTPRIIAEDNRDDIVLCLQLAGTISVSGCGRVVSLRRGDAMLLPYQEPGTVHFPARGARYLGLQIPRAAIAQRVSGVNDAVMRRIPPDSDALRLLARYLAVLDGGPFPASAPLQQALALHIHDLAALAIGASREGAELAACRGVRHARLAAIKAYVEENIHSSELSAAGVAARHGITPRYLHKLFEGEETSFSGFVLARRLERARHLLEQPRYANQTITAIAHEAGFNDLSYFNRRFRQRYGVVPSNLRYRRSTRRKREGSDEERPLE
ncbi:MAG TPA: helix-turn-helix domain-containing protein [Arenicellales bacterium]|nr:helix-turn-helix domain-containing protein [Arenicellales bacterium]